MIYTKPRYSTVLLTIAWIGVKHIVDFGTEFKFLKKKQQFEINKRRSICIVTLIAEAVVFCYRFNKQNLNGEIDHCKRHITQNIRFCSRSVTFIFVSNYVKTRKNYFSATKKIKRKVLTWSITVISFGIAIIDGKMHRKNDETANQNYIPQKKFIFKVKKQSTNTRLMFYKQNK